MRQIPLKKKYLGHWKGRYSGGERPAPKKHRNKMTDVAKRNLPPQPKVYLHVNGLTGAGVYVKVWQ